MPMVSIPVRNGCCPMMKGGATGGPALLGIGMGKQRALVGNAPNVLASSYNIKAEVEIPEGGAEGILVSLPVSFLETPVNRFYRLDTQHLQARDVPENQEKQWAAAAKRFSVIVATQCSRQSCFISFSILKAIWHICLSNMCFRPLYRHSQSRQPRFGTGC